MDKMYMCVCLVIDITTDFTNKQSEITISENPNEFLRKATECKHAGKK